MFFLLMALWLLFNARVTAEILLVGAALCALLTAFCVKFLDYPIKKELRCIRLIPCAIGYLGALLCEILKCNIALCRLGLRRRAKVSPVLVTFHTPLKSRLAKAVLADSITLTPGTITALCEGDTLTVHCLDERFSEGVENSVFQRRLLEMEAKAYGR